MGGRLRLGLERCGGDCGGREDGGEKCEESHVRSKRRVDELGFGYCGSSEIV